MAKFFVSVLGLAAVMAEQTHDGIWCIFVFAKR